MKSEFTDYAHCSLILIVAKVANNLSIVVIHFIKVFTVIPFTFLFIYFQQAISDRLHVFNH